MVSFYHAPGVAFVLIQMLDNGRVVQYDDPHILLLQTDGQFARMVRQAGSDEEERLLKIAKDHYVRRESLQPGHSEDMTLPENIVGLNGFTNIAFDDSDVTHL